MCFNKSLFVSLKPTSTKYIVVLPNGTHCLPSLLGAVQITPSIVLEDVLYIPSFKFNLLSVSSLL